MKAHRPPFVRLLSTLQKKDLVLLIAFRQENVVLFDPIVKRGEVAWRLSVTSVCSLLSILFIDC